MPPFAGPRPRLCWTRKPVKTETLPSSIFTGKWTVSSRRGSPRTRRVPSSRLRRSAARSNCCCATSQGLIRVATCSVVMGGEILVVVDLTPRSIALPGGDEYRSDGPCGPADSHPDATRPQPDRNLRCAANRRGSVVAPRSRERTSPLRRSVERDRSDAARPEVRSDRWSDEIDRHLRGVDAARDPCEDLGLERFDARIGRVEDREALDRPGADELDEPLASLSLRPHPIGRFDESVRDADDRLDREQRADRGLGAADPTAALEVLERVEGQEHADVVAAGREDARDLLRGHAELGHVDPELGERALT